MIEELKVISASALALVDQGIYQLNCMAQLQDENAELMVKLDTSQKENEDLKGQMENVIRQDGRWVRYNGPIPEGYELAELRDAMADELVIRDSITTYAYRTPACSHGPEIILRKIEHPVPGRWRAKDGENYWTTNCGNVVCFKECHSERDNLIWDTWIYEQTREAAVVASDRAKKAVRG